MIAMIAIIARFMFPPNRYHLQTRFLAMIAMIAIWWKPSIRLLADNFLERNDETRGGALSNFHKMKICLRYLCDPGYQKGAGQELGVSQATVSRTVNSVVDRIIGQANKWIKFPSTNGIIAF